MLRRRHFKHTTSLKERLLEEARQRREAPPGALMDEALRKARQAEAGAHMDDWLNFPGLQPPKNDIPGPN